MKKLLFIYNPVAGKGKVTQELASVLDVFTKCGYLVTAYPTQSKGDAARVARELGPDYDRVVCAGGDGTLSETVSGLVEVEHPPVLGYIPIGSTNDCARNLCLPARAAEAAAIAARDGKPRLWDVGTLNETPFFYIAAFGAFTDVAYDTPQELKNTFGHLAYVMAGLASLTSIKPYRLRVEYDGKVLEDEFLFGMVCNTIFVGGFKTLSENVVAVDDGMFEVVLVKKPMSSQEFFGAFQALLNRMSTIGESGPLIGVHASKLKITSQTPLPWTLDGEYGGKHTESLLENHSKAITVMQGNQN